MKIKVGDKVRWFTWKEGHYETVSELLSGNRFYTKESTERKAIDYSYISSHKIGPEGWTIKRNITNYPKRLIK